MVTGVGQLQDKWPLCATFWEVKGGKGRGGGCQQRVLIPTHPLHPDHPLSTTHAVTSCCQSQMKGLCVFMAGFVCVLVCKREESSK